MAKSTKKASEGTEQDPSPGRSAPATSAKGRAASGTAAASATVATGPFDQEFLDEQRALLVAERKRYLKSADALKAEADALVNEREPGDVQFDEESGEGDSLAVERERDLALSAQARAAVELIDAALKRLDGGTYGVCIHSGEPIPKERLEAIPWAAERVEFKTGSFRS